MAVDQYEREPIYVEGCVSAHAQVESTCTKYGISYEHFICLCIICLHISINNISLDLMVYSISYKWNKIKQHNMLTMLQYNVNLLVLTLSITYCWL